MKLSGTILGLSLFSPFIYTIYHVLSRFTQVDYFLLISFSSLIALSLLNYSSIVLLSLMLIPSLVSFGIFLLGNPFPLIGLAAGYLLAFPSFILLSSYKEKVIENIVLGYLFALIFNIWILYSTDRVFLDSSDFFVNLIIRVPENFITEGQYTLSQSVDNGYKVLTAISCISLFFIIFRRIEPEFPRDIGEITPLLISTIIILALAFTTQTWVYSSIIVAFSAFIIILVLSIILRIVK